MSSFGPASRPRLPRPRLIGDQSRAWLRAIGDTVGLLAVLAAIWFACNHWPNGLRGAHIALVLINHAGR